VSVTHYRVGDGHAPSSANTVIDERLVSNYTHVTFDHAIEGEADWARSSILTTKVRLGYDESKRDDPSNLGRHPEVRIYDHDLALAALAANLTDSLGNPLVKYPGWCGKSPKRPEKIFVRSWGDQPRRELRVGSRRG